ncbi:MAG: hypothetical protein R6X13_03875, partial [bacterium]
MKFLLASLLLLGATQAGPVRLSGSVYLGGEQGWVTGDDSLTSPVSDLGFSLNPTLSLWGFPVSLDVLMNSQESGLRQQLNKFRLSASPAAWALTRATQPWLATTVQSVEIGTCRPSWTPLTLSGEPVAGGAFELNPW